MSRTGGAPQSDVAFNPWYNRQCAIIDQRGQWSIWDLEGHKRKGNLCDAKAIQSGCVLDASSSENADGNTTGEDGWTSVCWAGDVSTLVACNRRHLAIFDLKSDPPTRLKVPPLDLVRTSSWILDIRRSPINNSHLFVVTSSQVFKLEISGNDPGVGPANWKSGAQILLSWRHFRDGDDISMRLEVMGSRDGKDSISGLELYDWL
jgi:RNA polymerase I-specific transcription initiation factor RRN6